MSPARPPEEAHFRWAGTHAVRGVPHPASTSLTPSHKILSGASRPRTRGAATLSIVLLLSFVAVLVVLHAHRDVVFDLRSAANEARAAQAHEAAQAGLEWAIALLNRPEQID